MTAQLAAIPSISVNLPDVEDASNLFADGVGITRTNAAMFIPMTPNQETNEGIQNEAVQQQAR